MKNEQHTTENTMNTTIAIRRVGNRFEQILVTRPADGPMTEAHATWHDEDSAEMLGGGVVIHRGFWRAPVDR